MPVVDVRMWKKSRISSPLSSALFRNIWTEVFISAVSMVPHAGMPLVPSNVLLGKRFQAYILSVGEGSFCYVKLIHDSV